MALPPTPETTLVILLGASEWPLYPDLDASSAFSNAAEAVIQYFHDFRGFRLPQGNLLNLFNSDRSSDSIDNCIDHFLKKRIGEKKGKGAPTAKDVLVYFIGHGAIPEGTELLLTIRRTRKNNPGISSLSIKGLARTLREQARFQRLVIILDCCFAAAAVKSYQSTGPIDIMRMQTNEAFKGFPERGATFICSSSSKDLSRFLPDGSSTMFTQAWLHALRTGSPSQQERMLTLRVIHRLAVDFLLKKYGNEVPKPEIHSPDQSEGDVADIPFFPNLAHEQAIPREGPCLCCNQSCDLPFLCCESCRAFLLALDQQATEEGEQTSSEQTVNIDQLIKTYRKSKQWTPEELAKHLNVSTRTVSRWERGEAKPSAKNLRQFLLLQQSEKEQIPSGSAGSIGKRIQTCRKSCRAGKGWTQKELAERVGVVRRTVMRWEGDKVKPDPEDLKQLMIVLEGERL